MTIFDTLRALSLYPINPLTVQNIAEECGLSADDDASAEVRASDAYKKAQAHVYMYLAEAPNVTEAGASYSFTDAERDAFRRKAATLLDAIGETLGGDLECGWIAEDF